MTKTDALVEELRALLAKATPGPWDMDSEYDDDALYSGGGGCGRGYKNFFIGAEVRGKWATLFDSVNADEKLIEEDYDEDGKSSWDAIGHANAALIVWLRNHADDILAALTPPHEGQRPTTGLRVFGPPEPEPVDGEVDEATVERMAIRDIAAERQRQIDAEGWTPEHDDEHRDDHALPRAAACYALAGTGGGNGPFWITHLQTPQQVWPYRWEWKPADRRRNLVKAAALIVAEIERLDRAALRGRGAGRPAHDHPRGPRGCGGIRQTSAT